MSRRFHGRFGGNSSEAYQRQLGAPVHKWKKAWVSPTGLQPESSYKICKWVRVDAAVEDGSLAPDEDEEMDEGDEGDDVEVDGEDGADIAEDIEGGAEAHGETDLPAAPAAAEAVDAVPTVPTVAAEVPALAAPLETPPVPTRSAVLEPAVPLSQPTAPTADAVTVQASSSDTPGPIPSASAPIPEAAAPPSTHTLPANAIEIHNTAPHTTEMGAGDLAGVGGVEMTHGETKPASEAEGEAEKSGMEVDQPLTAEPEAVTEVADVEQGQVPEVDEGLVMGDVEPVREEFIVDGEDKPREVDA